jgi:hypothetical protein
MSLEINDVNELQKLLAALDLKVQSLEELKGLLAVVQGATDPETARLKTIRQIGYQVPGIMAAAAGIVSFFLILFSSAGNSAPSPALLIGCLTAIWGAVALVSVPAVLSSMILLARLKITPPAPSSGLGAAQRFSESFTVRKEP